MKLEFIALGNLSVSKSNMRHARKAPDVADILPTVRARGVLQPVSYGPVHRRKNISLPVPPIRRRMPAGRLGITRSLPQAGASMQPASSLPSGWRRQPKPVSPIPKSSCCPARYSMKRTMPAPSRPRLSRTSPGSIRTKSRAGPVSPGW